MLSVVSGIRWEFWNVSPANKEGQLYEGENKARRRISSAFARTDPFHDSRMLLSLGSLVTTSSWSFPYSLLCVLFLISLTV